MIIRVEKNRDNPFFLAPRRAFQDQRLPFEARGVLGYALSKPDGWEMRIDDLMREGNCGRDYVRGILKVLSKYGYLIRRRIQDSDGKFRWITIIRDDPALPESKNTSAVNQQTADAAEEKQADPCSLYERFFERPLSTSERAAFAEITEPDVWQECLTYWRDHHHNPSNTMGLLDNYRRAMRRRARVSVGASSAESAMSTNGAAAEPHETHAQIIELAEWIKAKGGPEADWERELLEEAEKIKEVTK